MMAVVILFENRSSLIFKNKIRISKIRSRVCWIASNFLVSIACLAPMTFIIPEQNKAKLDILKVGINFYQHTVDKNKLIPDVPLSHQRILRNLDHRIHHRPLLGDLHRELLQNHPPGVWTSSYIFLIVLHILPMHFKNHNITSNSAVSNSFLHWTYHSNFYPDFIGCDPIDNISEPAEA